MGNVCGMVSFLIPCYNHEDFVNDCLNSIYNQTYSNIEVIVCDDCSSDDSVLRIQDAKIKFEQKGINFCLIQNKKNCGLTPNLNKMLSLAKGEFIKIIASDDMLKSNYLEVMINVFKQNDRIKFVYSNCIKVKENSHYPVDKSMEMGEAIKNMPLIDENIVSNIYLDNFVLAPAILFKHDILKEVGGYDENIGIEDLEMSLKILEKYPDALGYFNDCLVYYRVNENSMTSTKNNSGAKKRVKYMYKNSMAIAKKYKHAVPKKVYRKRVVDLTLFYIFKMRDLILGK